MTEKEIVQALRTCASGETEECPFTEKYGCDGCPRVSADLIERLTAENADLRKEIERKDMVITPERLRELAAADKDERVVALPCKVGERWADADGRAVRITAVVVSIEPFGTNINIYFDDEGATPDDAGSDCAANWDYFSRHYTCIEVERAMEGKKDV